MPWMWSMRGAESGLPSGVAVHPVATVARTVTVTVARRSERFMMVSVSGLKRAWLHDAQQEHADV